MNDSRETNGRFAPGRKGGPGRPRRAVERDYLAKLSDIITLEDFGAIVQRAVEDAKMGDPRARDFVAKYVLGENPGSLRDLSAKECVGLSVRRELVDAAHAHRVESAQTLSHRLNTSSELLERMHPIVVVDLPSESPIFECNDYQHPVSSEECQDEGNVPSSQHGSCG